MGIFNCYQADDTMDNRDEAADHRRPVRLPASILYPSALKRN